jgi:hypothetical protein
MNPIDRIPMRKWVKDIGGICPRDVFQEGSSLEWNAGRWGMHAKHNEYPPMAVHLNHPIYEDVQEGKVPEKPFLSSPSTLPACLSRKISQGDIGVRIAPVLLEIIEIRWH